MCPTPIEGLATNGIVHFDPNAYIRDGASQYIAEQDAYLPFDKPLYATPFPGAYPVPVMRLEQPHQDVYIRHEKHSSSLGGAIIGFITGALAAYLGYEIFKDKNHTDVVKPGDKPVVKPDATAELKTTGEKVKDKAKGFFEDAKDLAKEAKDKVVSFVKGKKGESQVDKVVNEAAKNSVKEQKSFFKTRFYKTKIGLGIAAGLAALYALYRVFVGRSHQGSKE